MAGMLDDMTWLEGYPVRQQGMFGVYSDTPGGGNVYPYQLANGASPDRAMFPRYAQNQDVLQQLLAKYPMTPQQRLQLERLLMDGGLNADIMAWAMRPDQQKLKEMRYLPDGVWDTILPLGRRM